MILNTLRAMLWATEVGLHRRFWILSPASKTRRSLNTRVIFVAYWLAELGRQPW
jgi:hypothetical protein